MVAFREAKGKEVYVTLGGAGTTPTKRHIGAPRCGVPCGAKPQDGIVFGLGTLHAACRTVVPLRKPMMHVMNRF